MKLKTAFLLIPAISLSCTMHAQTVIYGGDQGGVAEIYNTAIDCVHGKKDTTYTYIKYKYYKKGEDPNDKKAGVKFVDLKIYGFKDRLGYIFRMSTIKKYKDYVPYLRVLDTGKIWLYIDEGVPVTPAGKKVNNEFEMAPGVNGRKPYKRVKYPPGGYSPAELKVTKVDLCADPANIVNPNSNVGPHGSITVSFDKKVYISKGPDGPLLGCNEENMEALMADDPDMVADIKKTGIKIKPWNQSKLNDEYNTVSEWIADYNQRHK